MKNYCTKVVEFMKALKGDPFNSKTKNIFRQFHDDLDRLRGRTSYARGPKVRLVKGKKAIRAAKRERVKAMKAAQQS